VLRIVEQVVPSTFGSMDSVHAVPNDDRRHYAFEATRSPFTAFASGNAIHLRTTLSYSARGYFKPRIGPTLSAGCGQGKERPRVVVELATPVTLSADWHLVSHARVVSVAAASMEHRDHCDVTILHKDVTESVVGAARNALIDHLDDIDRRVHTVDLTGHATEWWRTLARPIRLADSVWLVLAPEQLSIGSVAGRSRMITVPVSLRARPRVVTGTAPDTVFPPLPPLGKGTSDDGFHIAMDGILDYSTASRELTKALAGKTFTAKGHTIRLVRATVLPAADGQLGLTLAFDGDAQGTLQLAGSPRVDTLKGVVTVPDLAFDLQTANALLKSYTWLRSDVLREELRARARIPVADALAKGRGLLMEGLNRKIGDALTIAGRVDSVAVRDLFVTRDGLVVRAEATGRAGVLVRQH
jgi:hypothetical protein